MAKENKEIITLGKAQYGIAYSSAKIDFPEYDEIKKRVDKINEEFTKYEVTVENLKSAKETRATLNKLSQALNSKKIAIVKEINQPVTEFQNRIKDLTSEIGDASSHIDSQIKTYEDNARRQKEELLRKDIDKRCKEAGVDPTKIIYNQKWLNKTASYSAFEEDVNNQIAVLQKEQEQYSENVKVITAKANELGLPYQHWVKMLDTSSLSEIMIQMDDYAQQIKEAAERENKAKKEQAGKVVSHNGKAIDKSTGEVVSEDSIKAYLFTRTSKIELSGTSYQFSQLMQYLNDMGFGINIEKRVK